ncbi:MAG: YkvA family protein [Halanaerobium sp.]|nr:YkvA family protein [Halanaerobium sp.]
MIIQRIVRLLLSKRTPFYLKVVFFLSLLYIISPIDLVSDFIPLAGWADDLLLGIIWWLYLKGDKMVKEEAPRKGDDNYLDLEEDDYRVD